MKDREPQDKRTWYEQWADEIWERYDDNPVGLNEDEVTLLVAYSPIMRPMTADQSQLHRSGFAKFIEEHANEDKTLKD